MDLCLLKTAVIIINATYDVNLNKENELKSDVMNNLIIYCFKY